MPRLLETATVIVGLALTTAASAQTYDVLKSFDDLANPRAELLVGSDGLLYGTTHQGGEFARGGVFRISADGAVFEPLHSFDYSTDGGHPEAPLIEASAGLFYGTTGAAGPVGNGTAFRISADGSAFLTLAGYDSATAGFPGAMTLGSDGYLYGASSEGAFGWGAVFKIAADGSGFAIVHTFDGDHGAGPSSLVEGPDGALYGATGGGGSGSAGTVFRLAKDGSPFTVLHDFDGALARSPSSPLLLAADGSLYGTTSTGGADDVGSLYRISLDGSSFEVVYTFGAQNSLPSGRLVQDANGFLYGTTPSGGLYGRGTAYQVSPDGSSFFLIHRFAEADGSAPFAGLIVGPDGALYGTTFTGGANDKGVVYRLSVEGATDGDHDGYLDGVDNCPLEANPGQDDTDENGIGDACDIPLLSVSDTAVTEPDSGTVNADFTVSLSKAASGEVTVVFETANDHATPGVDYVTRPPTSLIFGVGETSKVVSVKVKGDKKNEDDERFALNLVEATGATIARSQGTATIVENDPLPILSIDSVSTVEGSGQKTLTFRVSLTPASGRLVSLNYETADGTATVGGDDYVHELGALTFNPGNTSKTVSIALKGDLIHEADETFLVNLSFPMNAALGAASGTGTILDDDPAEPAVQATIGDVTLDEGDTGSHNAVFTVSLSPAPTQKVSVAYATASETANAGSDYTAKAGSLTFNAGQTSKTISVSVKGDRNEEANETFTVHLATPMGVTIADPSAIGTIANDDDPPALSIGDASVTEGNSGMKNLKFTVTLSAATFNTVMVDFDTSDLSPAPGAATGAVDYSTTTGSLVFAPGQTSQTIAIKVLGDLAPEGPETFSVTLSNPNHASVADGEALGTIVDNE